MITPYWMLSEQPQVDNGWNAYQGGEEEDGQLVHTGENADQTSFGTSVSIHPLPRLSPYIVPGTPPIVNS